MSKSKSLHLKAWLAVFMALSLPVSVMAATPRSLVIGVYRSQDGAEQAFKELKAVQKDKAIKIDSYAVVERDAKGHVSVKDTQQRNAAWGAITGGILGLLVMGPVGGAAGLGAGGLGGWLTGKAVGIPKEDIQNVEAALQPNTSALIAVIDNKWVADVEKAIKKQATAAYINRELKDQEQAAAESGTAEKPSETPEKAKQKSPAH